MVSSTTRMAVSHSSTVKGQEVNGANGYAQHQRRFKGPEVSDRNIVNDEVIMRWEDEEIAANASSASAAKQKQTAYAEYKAATWIHGRDNITPIDNPYDGLVHTDDGKKYSHPKNQKNLGPSMAK